MVNNPKISFILPVYNTEQYLEECVNSILLQTFSDFELLLINDGSTDESGSICDRLAKIDNRISVYHIENNGSATARNFGIDHAKGEYINFIDSDDRLANENVVNNIINFLRDKIVDITFLRSSEFRDTFDKPEAIQEPYAFDEYYNITGEDMLLQIHIKNEIAAFSSPVNKIFSLKFLKEKNVRFINDFKWHAENEFLHKAIFNANSFYYYNAEIYYYVRIRPGSLTTKNSEDIIIKKAKTKYDLSKMCCEYFDERVNNKLLNNYIFRFFIGMYIFGYNSYFSVVQSESRDAILNIYKNSMEIFKFAKKTNSINLKILYYCQLVLGAKTTAKIIGARYKMYR